MTHYYNGESLDESPESVSSQLSERGMSREEGATLIHLACRQTWARPCCEGFRRIYESVIEEIDFGERAIVGYAMLAVTDIAPDGEKDHEWVHIRYCPFCGTRLRYKLEENEDERKVNESQ